MFCQCEVPWVSITLNSFRTAVDKSNLYPPAPPLTRYKETTFPIIKRKLTEAVVLDDGVNDKLNHLTASKLCVRLNTLQVSAILSSGNF